MNWRKILVGVISLCVFCFLMMGGLQIIGVIDHEGEFGEIQDAIVLESGKNYVGITTKLNVVTDKGVIEVSETKVYQKKIERRQMKKKIKKEGSK